MNRDGIIDIVQEIRWKVLCNTLCYRERLGKYWKKIRLDQVINVRIISDRTITVKNVLIMMVVKVRHGKAGLDQS